jgi:hypothetical protein
MPLSITDAKRIAEEKEPCQFKVYYGPVRIGPALIWELWVINRDRDFDVRFVSEENGEQLYFSSFAEIAAHVDSKFVKLSRDAADIHVLKFTRYVAAFVFVATVLTMLYLTVVNGSTQSTVLTALIGVVASGAALFFGRWIPGIRSGP